MIQTKIIAKGSRFLVVSPDGRKVYGDYGGTNAVDRALRRQRHILNSSRPRRERKPSKAA